MPNFRSPTHRWQPGLVAVFAAAALVSTAGWCEEARQTRLRLSNQVSKRNVGSAKQLDGVVYVYHVFLSDPQSSWSRGEKQHVKFKLGEAYDFITLHSRLHGKSVTFVDEFGTDVRLERAIPQDAHADPDWTERAIQAASQLTGFELVERIQSDSRAEQVVICLHVNKPALSFNLAYYEDVARRYTAERMICFSAYPDGRETSAATYAHEVLHLFGAGDLYFPYDRDARRKHLAGRHFPNDVMFRVDYELDRLDVGPFTAYRVGWIEELEPEFSLFEDVGDP